MTYLLIALLVSTSVVFSRSEEMRCRLTAFAVPLAGKCSRVPSRIYSSKRSSRVAIVGGGLSGLSTAYHLLQKSPALDVTIIDKAEPGVAGASAVAGG